MNKIPQITEEIINDIEANYCAHFRESGRQGKKAKSMGTFFADRLNAHLTPKEPVLSDLQKRLVSEGWTAWHGGERPVDKDALVQVTLRDKSRGFADSARGEQWVWADRGFTTDIIAYRLAQPEWNLLSHVEKHFGPLPDGAKFHREDFTREMLPDGYRPLLAKEHPVGGDEYKFDDGRDKFHAQANHPTLSEKGAETYSGFWRTRRPLAVAPRVVEWDFNSAPNTPFTVKRKENGVHITVISKGLKEVRLIGIYHDSHATYGQLLASFCQLDGMPCGTPEGGK